MLAVGAASAVGAMASTTATTAVTHAISGLIFGTFNPNYKKEDRKRMRYIQSKYSQAYGDGSDDANVVIASIDNDSRLKMTPDGLKPANPFPDERAFDDALVMNFYPVPGHQGKFCASHAKAALGVIIEYQNQRRKRIWVPKVSSPGRPNDYINMFLEEMKSWLRNQLTLDNVSAEELSRRSTYITKLKHDNYYWCFPNELSDYKVHHVIDFIHERIQNALEIVQREERNKSLQTLFMELNDHTMNGFEFGKIFLAYICYHSKSGGADLIHSNQFDGSTYERGKLYKLLMKATNSVMKVYVSDMRQSQINQDLIEDHTKPSRGGGLATKIYPSTAPSPLTLCLTNNATTATPSSSLPGGGGDHEGKAEGNADDDDDMIPEYQIEMTEYERETALTSTIFLIYLTDRQMNQRWLLKKKYSDFMKIHKKVITDFENNDKPLYLPAPPRTGLFSYPKHEELLEASLELKRYLSQLINDPEGLTSQTKLEIAKFIEVKTLALPTKSKYKKPENIPNYFVNLKSEFIQKLVENGNDGNSTAPSTSGTASSATGRGRGGEGGGGSAAAVAADEKAKKLSHQQMIQFREIWGINYSVKIYEAYGLLQRMSTILGWTLEINHFFVSMFGNTLAFSKLPLKDLLATQKEIMAKLNIVTNEIFLYACDVNAQQDYKWHKNLQTSENELKRMKYHLEKAIHVITRIENEHLDYNAQMKRLEDVAARFAPLMHRLDTNLPSIQQELGLPLVNTQLGGTGTGEGRGELFDQSNGNRQGTLALRDVAEEKKSSHDYHGNREGKGGDNSSSPGDEINEKMVPRVEFLEDEEKDDVPRGRTLAAKEADDKEGGAAAGGLRKEEGGGVEDGAGGGDRGGAKESHVCGIS